MMISDFQDTTDESPIDIEGLFARCMGNLQLVERVLTSFQNHFTEDLDELEAAVEAKDRDRTKQIAHRMKGASANAGATRIAGELASIETLADSGEMDFLLERMTLLHDEWNRCQASALKFPELTENRHQNHA